MWPLMLVVTRVFISPLNSLSLGARWPNGSAVVLYIYIYNESASSFESQSSPGSKCIFTLCVFSMMSACFISIVSMRAVDRLEEQALHIKPLSLSKYLSFYLSLSSLSLLTERKNRNCAWTVIYLKLNTNIYLLFVSHCISVSHTLSHTHSL